jgi:ATP-binding cassette, subfamily B, bacterial PglK
MLNIIKELFSILTDKQRKNFYLLQVLVILMAIFEVLSIGAFGSLMAIVSDTNIILNNTYLQELYNIFNAKTTNEFIYLYGFIVLFIIFLAAIISIFTTWKLSLFGTSIGAELGDRLYKYYISQPWLFHTINSSSKLTQKIAVETDRVTMTILVPLLQINAKLIIVVFIIISILLYNPIPAIVGFFIFTTAYAILYKATKKILDDNGKIFSKSAQIRFKLMSEAFGTVKDVLLLHKQDYFVEQFQKSGKLYALSRGKNQALTQIPRYFIELIIFTIIIIFILNVTNTKSGNISDILIVLSLYAMAGLKLLPAFQQIYINISRIKGNLASYRSVKKDLFASVEKSEDKLIKYQYDISLKNNIELKNICFSYSSQNKYIFNNLNLKIPINKTIGIVGESGSGKSTLIDLLLGLVKPSFGDIYIGEEKITDKNLFNWQSRIGFVPQNIVLTDNTIKENIAFGISLKNIDMDKISNAIKMSHLEKVIENLPLGLETIIGERGVQLSGGQRQRIGIARALYNEPEILVLDEATSALDGQTEKVIMDAINDFSGEKTIIMIAHRLKTIEKCDKVFIFDKGNVIDEGTYLELLEKNKFFKDMTKYS